METSPQIGAIAGALAKAQAGLGVLLASKDVKNKDGTVRYTYANLADALSACRETLNANGIAVVQCPATSEGAGIEVTTMLVHESGEWIKSPPLFMPVQGGAQDAGSAITYARRYSLLAMVGLAPEDDDGKAAQANAPDSWGQRGSQRQATSKAPARISDANVKTLEDIMDVICKVEGSEMGPVFVSLLDTAEVSDNRPERADGLTAAQGARMVHAAKQWAQYIADEAGT